MIYTRENPKLVEIIYFFENQTTFTGVVKDKDNNICYYLNGKYHRIDEPAIEWANGGKEWYLNGKGHRTDGPAIEYASGRKYWYLNGEYYGGDDDFTTESWIRFVKLELLK